MEFLLFKNGDFLKVKPTCHFTVKSTIENVELSN